MRRVLTSGIFVVFCFLTVTILSQVPQLLNYQGRLADAAGIPITTTTTVRFSLYQGGDAATPGSGTLCYQEDASVIPDDNGVFNHLIGSGSVIFGALDATVFQTADPVYLEITVDPAGANETLLPRKQIVSVGYSFNAEVADDADCVDGEHASAFSPVVHNHDADYVNMGEPYSVTSEMIVNGTIVDADINESANIAASKIDPTGLNADMVDGEHASAFSLVVHNHDADYVNEGEPDSVTSGMIVNGTIVDADINAGANIAASKINTTGLDADLVDGEHADAFVHTTGDNMTGSFYIDTDAQWALYCDTSRATGVGIYGWATALTGKNYGVYGLTNSPTGYAGYFSGNTHVKGNFTVAEGSKTCVQPIDNGKKVLLYAMESPEIWFEDFGTAQLVNGQAVVQLESIFTQAANIEMGYLIFLTPIGECNGLYIAQQDKDAFEVRELGGGTSSISFYYRIVAKRRGYEEVRFEEFTEPEQPPEEPNLPVEKK
ncbi:MAG: hypothetical protein ACETWC_02740 [Acidobacteriota bacterium]